MTEGILSPGTTKRVGAMQVHVFSEVEALAEAAGQRIVAAVQRIPNAVIGLATGSSPVATYRAWGRQAAELGLDQSAVRGFALDEYVGIEPSDPRSYHSVIRRDAIANAGLRPELVRVPDGNSDSGESERYERRIREAGGIDVQVLGLGRNGHLGFNEPGSADNSRTRVVELAGSTVADNSRFFATPAEVPTHAITQGLGTIFEARELLVIAVGEAKAEAVRGALYGPDTEQLPASLLRRHPNVHWFLDESAASKLSL